MRAISFLLGAALSLGLDLQGLAQCNSCEPDLSCAAADFPVLCPETLADATAGEPYEEVITFNLPPVVVDPATDLSVDLLSVTISSVMGLPFGLEFTPSNADGTYEPGNGETYGCATVCGTPLSAGEYLVDINVAVVASAFGFEQSVDQSFSLALTVLPGDNPDAVSSFELSTLSGCAPLDMTGTALVTDVGASYAWDLGNGQSSNAANPTFTFDSTGTYTVQLATEVEALALTQVAISSLGGGWGQDLDDFFGQPDPYFVLSDANGTLYTSAYGSETQTPTLGGFSIPLDFGASYNIAFYDSDTFTNDDFLGASDFVAEGGGDVTVSNSTTATLTLTSSIVGSFNESLSVVVFDDLDVWLDMDGDGFGDPAVPVDACDPANTLPYAFNDADCDDANANVYLDASPTGEGVDNNCDGVLSPDEMVPCPGDLNLDTQVSVADVLVMLSDFGCISACESDLTSDGSVGVEDLLALLAYFGTQC